MSSKIDFFGWENPLAKELGSETLALKLSQKVRSRELKLSERECSKCSAVSASILPFVEAFHGMLWGLGAKTTSILKTVLFDSKSLPQWIQVELEYIQLVLSRTHKVEKGQPSFEDRSERSLTMASRIDFHRLAPRVLLEKSFQLLNLGKPLESLELIEEAQGYPTELCSYYETITHSASLINYLNIGQLNNAERCFRIVRKKLSENPCELLQLKYEYSLLLLAEVKEERLLKKNSFSTLVSSNSSSSLLFDQSMLRHLIRKGDLSLAKKQLQRIKKVTGKESVSRFVVNLDEEEMELSVAEGRASASQIVKAERIVSEAVSSGDKRAQLRTMTLFGALCALSQDLTRAETVLKRALKIGHENHLKCDNLDAHFHMAGVLHLKKQKAKALGYLDRMCNSIREIGLKSLEPPMTYLNESYAEDSISAGPLANLLSSSEWFGNERRFGFENYKFIQNVETELVESGHRFLLNEKSFRDHVFRNDGVYFFENKNEILFLSRKNHWKVVSLKSDEVNHERLKTFVFDRRQFTLAELHALHKQSLFDSDRHGPSLRAWVSKLKQDLIQTPLSLAFDSTLKCYRVESDVKIYRVKKTSRSKNIGGKDSSSLSAREKSILSFAQNQETITVSELCREFVVTRQALNPALKKLVSEGHLRLVKRGPRSYYRSLTMKNSEMSEA